MCNNIKSNPLLPYFFAFILAFSGGFADAASFILLGVFSGHLTGNSVLSLIWAIEGSYATLIISIMALAGFISGTFTGIIWRRNMQQPQRMYQPLILELILIIAAIAARKILGETVLSTYIFAVGLSFSLGVQNGVYNHIFKASIHTTYITGTTTSLFEALLYTDPSNADKVFSKKVLLVIPCAFVLGAGVGAFMTHHFDINGFMLIIPVILISTYTCYIYTQTT